MKPASSSTSCRSPPSALEDRIKVAILLLLRCHNVKNGKKVWSYRRKIQQDALGKVDRVKEIRRREKNGLKRICCCFDVTTLKMAREPVKLQKENPAGCAGEGRQSKGNQEKRKGRFIPPISFWDEVTRRRWRGRCVR